MDEIMRIVFQYAPMNGACNKIMKQSIHDYERAYSYVLLSDLNPRSYKEWFVKNITFSNWILDK